LPPGQAKYGKEITLEAGHVPGSKISKQPAKKQKKRKYAPREKPSIKTPGPQLNALLGLAALVPPGVRLPPELIETDPIFREAGVPQPATPEEITAAIQRLPTGTIALQVHLLALMNQPDEWPSDYRVLAGPGANKVVLEIMRQTCQADAVRNRYGLILNGNEALRRIASQNEQGSFVQDIVTTTLMIRMDKRSGKSIALYDPIYAALIGEELDCIKSCPRCGKLFFAPRVNSIACKTCREAYRKKKQRNHKNEAGRDNA